MSSISSTSMDTASLYQQNQQMEMNAVSDYAKEANEANQEIKENEDKTWQQFDES